MHYFIDVEVLYIEFDAHVLTRIIKILTSVVLFLVIAMYFQSSTRLHKKIRTQMKEYLNLLDRVNEGVIVIANDKNNNKFDDEVQIQF